MDLAGEQVIRGHFETQLINDRPPTKSNPKRIIIYG